MQCGEIPVVPNGQVPAKQKPYNNGGRVPILCAEGFEAQVRSLVCKEGEWSSGESALKDICKRTSSADRNGQHKGPLPSLIYACVRPFAAMPSNCLAPPKFDNAIITTPFKKEYLSDSNVVYECRPKYLLLGENNLRCQNGEWEEKNITCACTYISKRHNHFKQHQPWVINLPGIQATPILSSHTLALHPCPA